MDARPAADEPVAPRVCSRCLAEVDRHADTCWLCEEPLLQPTAPAEQAPDLFSLSTSPYEPEPHRDAGLSFSISSILLLTTLVAIIAALIAAEPWLGVPSAIIMAPILVRTAMVVRQRKAMGRTVSVLQKLALITSSLYVAVIILALACVAGIGLLFAMCAGRGPITGHGGGGDNSTAFIIALIVLAASCWTLIWIFKWIRRRYRDDVNG